MSRIEAEKEPLPIQDILFRTIAKHYPTEKIGSSKILAAIWRILFYSIRPTLPFIMRLPFYDINVHPGKHTLTKVVIRRGYWEPAETAFFAQNLKPGSFVIDAGANFGHYALVASSLVGADGLVVAFEPYPLNYNLLMSNIDLLPIDNVIAEQAGLAATSGSMMLITDEANPGGHSFNPNLIWKAGKKINVPIYALDNYLEQKGINRKVDILKSDTQGYEWQLISGARNTILRDRPIVFCEVAPDALAEIGDSHKDLLSFFEEADYKVFVVDRVHEKIITTNYYDLELRLKEVNCEYEDVIFTPN